MKKLFKIIIIFIILIIVALGIMFAFKICPPPGPWMMPPWCANKVSIKKGVETKVTFYTTVPYNTPQGDIYLALADHEQIKMEKVGYLSYQVVLPLKGQESITYKYVSSVGSSDSYTLKINKPNLKIYDGVTGWSELAWQPKFDKDFNFGVMMFDTWGRNYNFNMFENTRDNIESSFKRLADLGAKQVFVTEMLRAYYDDDQEDFSSLNYKIGDAIFKDDLRDEALTREDMNTLAQTAHKYDLEIGSEIGISFVDFGKYIGSNNISQEFLADYEKQQQGRTKAWIEDFYNKKEKKYLELAQELSSAGFDLMMINQRGDINNSPYDAYANQRLKQIIKKIKAKYNIKVGAFVYDWVPFNQEWNQTYDYYQDADEVYIIIEKIEDRYQPQPNMNFATIKTKFSRELNDITVWAEQKNIQLNIYFGPLSYDNAVVTGSVEFNDIKNPQIKNLKPNWQQQANVYEAFLQAAENKPTIKSVNFMLFWWDDAMDPDTARTRISICSSPRNKPAEAVIKKWAQAKND